MKTKLNNSVRKLKHSKKSSKHFNTETKSAKKIVRKTPKRNVKKTLKKISKKTKKQRKLKGGKRMIGGTNLDVECTNDKTNPSEKDCHVKKAAAAAPAAGSGAGAVGSAAGSAPAPAAAKPVNPMDCFKDIEDFTESTDSDEKTKDFANLQSYLDKMKEFILKIFKSKIDEVKKILNSNKLVSKDTDNIWTFCILLKELFISLNDFIKNNEESVNHDCFFIMTEMLSIFCKPIDRNDPHILLKFKELIESDADEPIKLEITNEQLKKNDVFKRIISGLSKMLEEKSTVWITLKQANNSNLTPQEKPILDYFNSILGNLE